MTGALVLVSVGSDHHPFQRVVDWADEIARTHPEVSVVVQHGHAEPPTVATGKPFLPHGELQDLMRRAAVIVVQGGPAGIFEARGHGVLPIVVPRRQPFGEHVDDHQRSFARFVTEAGRAVVAEDLETFRAIVERALANPAAFRVDPSNDGAEIAHSISAFEAVVSELVSSAPARVRRRRRPR